jgi:hypothetical protein
MNELTITKQQLDRCFLDWERDHRAGLCADYEATKGRPAEDVSRQASDEMWFRLEHHQVPASP